MTSQAQEALRDCLGSALAQRVNYYDAFVCVSAIRASGTPLLLAEKTASQTTVSLQIPLLDTNLLPKAAVVPVSVWASVFSGCVMPTN